MRLCPRCNTPYSNSTATCPRDGEVLSTLPQVMTELRVPQPIIPGSIVGNYQIIKKLGSGGMGAVYSATHLSLGKEVAIKILREDSAQNPKMLDRFYREARALAKIEHDNIIKTSDFGCTPEGLTYLVMELLVGRSLEDLLRAEKKLPVPRAIHIATQICSGLSAAHQRKIIHRDLKPENIFLISTKKDPDFVKVLDFGIAKQLDEESNTVSQLMGTPTYMAPETGASIDERTDIYALGVIFYRMFTGVLPFEGSNVMDILYKHLVEEPKPLRDHESSLPLHIETSVLRALSKNKLDRFSSMESFILALCQEDEDATRLRRIIPQTQGDDDVIVTPLDIEARSPDTWSEKPDEAQEKATVNGKKPKVRHNSTIPLGTSEIMIVAPHPSSQKKEPTIKLGESDVVEVHTLPASIPISSVKAKIRKKTPEPAKAPENIFTLSPPIADLPTRELPPIELREAPPYPEILSAPNPTPIFGELSAVKIPAQRPRNRLMVGLVGFLLLWGIVIVVLVFAAPSKVQTTAVTTPLPQAGVEAPKPIEIPAQATKTEEIKTEPDNVEVETTKPTIVPNLPNNETKENTTPVKPIKPIKPPPKKSKKTPPPIQGNPDLD